MSSANSSLHRAAPILLAAVLLAAMPADAAPRGDAILPLDRFDPQVPVLPESGTPAFETVVVLDGAPTRLALRRHSVRDPEFRVIVQDADGEHDVTPPAPATYRGEIVDVPGSLVCASLVDGQLSAIIDRPDGVRYCVQPAADLMPGAVDALHVGFNVVDVHPDGGTCGTDDAAVGDPVPLVSDPPGPLESAGESIAQLAFDTDFEYFVQNGSSVDQTVTDIERTVNGLGVIFRRDVGIDHFITRIIVRTVPSDPYTQTDSVLLLCEFRAHWNAFQGGIPRDTAHLMTGRNLDGTTIGRAWRAVVCNEEAETCGSDGSLAYGLSQSTNSVFANRVALTAHELGHNWGATHCDGDSDCAIMCANLGGCTGLIDRFASRAVGEILSHKGSRDCLRICASNLVVPVSAPTVLEGVYRSCWGADIVINAGNYNEAFRVNKAVTLKASGGSVVIGD